MKPQITRIGTTRFQIRQDGIYVERVNFGQSTWIYYGTALPDPPERQRTGRRVCRNGVCRIAY